MNEHPRSIELAPQLVHDFAQTFISRWDCYPLQLEDGSYTQMKEPLTSTIIFRHLTAFYAGMTPYTIGAYALSEHSEAKWICLDADTLDQWEALRQLARTLETEHVSTYLELSRRGGHLWLFTPLLSGAVIRQFGQQLLTQYHIPQYDSTGKKKLELYPKQDVLSEGSGSFMRLPLGVHRKTNQVHTFVTPEGKSLAPTVRAQIALLAKPELVPMALIQELLALPYSPPPQPVKETPQFKKRKARRGESLSETLKHTISVFDFISRYVELDHNNKGFCPFHDDQKKSFQVNIEHNYWHCYAGCSGQTIIDFWMRWREKHGHDGSFTATVKEMREMLLT